MPKWRISAFDGASQDDDVDEVVCGRERQIRTLLERLTSRHLSVREIIDSLESGAHFSINRDKQLGKPTQLSTTGTTHHYVALEVRDA